MNPVRYAVSLMAVLLLVTAPAAGAKPLRVVADIPPIHSLTARVMAGVGTPELLLNGLTAPHDFALRPSQAGMLAKADLVIWVGADLSPPVGRALEALGGDARIVELLAAKGLTRLPFREGPGFGDQGHDHGAETADPHIWLNLQNAAIMLDVIAAELAAADPDHATGYLRNAEQGKSELAALQAEINATLEPVRDRPFLVFHDAYHYFEDQFGIEALAAIKTGHALPPGVAHIREMRAIIADMGVICIFREPQFDSQLLARLTEGTGLKTGTLDPIGAELTPGKNLYPTLMRNLAISLADCLK
ncbi:MAG: zinc ABC transporter solute-binding protein [Rhodobacteraceae bacterium]|nr:zinc ABC transporter solute-binding protein [Paracoccaceae bacterium]